MSRPPKRSTVAVTHALAASMSPALAANTAVSPSISAAAISSRSCLRELSMTLAPASANDPAMARPIPFDAPVTSATLPSSEICMTRKLPAVDLQRRGVDGRIAADLDASDASTFDLRDREAPTLATQALAGRGHVLQGAEQEPGNGLPVLVGYPRLEQFVEILDVHAAVDGVVTIGEALDFALVLIVLVDDLANQFLQAVLERDETG